MHICFSSHTRRQHLVKSSSQISTVIKTLVVSLLHVRVEAKACMVACSSGLIFSVSEDLNENEITFVICIS